MLAGHLGNLKQKPNIKSTGGWAKIPKPSPRGIVAGGPGNNLKKPTETRTRSGLLTNSASNPNPEEYKSFGNEKYKQGKFEETLVLYDQAISLDSTKASFYSYKSVALMSLGRLIGVVFAGVEAIRIEPTYYNAHYRLARMFLGLGDTEKAQFHFTHSGRKSSSKDTYEA